MNLDDLKQAVEGRVAELDTIISGYGGNPYSEQELFHFTDIHGLKGIIDNGCLWSTHYEFFNDSSELRHLLSYVHQGIEQVRQANAVMKSGVDLLALAEKAWMTGSDGFDYYLTCFCENNDLLSQWRGYGALGEGFAVGFKPTGTSLETNAFKPVDVSRVLCKVKYDNNQVKQAIERLTAEFVKHCEITSTEFLESLGRKMTKLSPGEMNTAVDLLNELIVQIAVGASTLSYVYKHEAFAEEREWRLVDIRNRDEVQTGIKFRPRGGLLIPYVETPVNFPDSDGFCFEITSVMCGPSRYPELKRRSVESFLKAKGLGHVPVSESSTPFRVL